MQQKNTWRVQGQALLPRQLHFKPDSFKLRYLCLFSGFCNLLEKLVFLLHKNENKNTILNVQKL